MGLFDWLTHRKKPLSKMDRQELRQQELLLEKQREGKKRMKQIGSIEIPQEAFLAVLSMENTD